ncbi:DUF5819 family protein [Streptomyces sp. NPDC050504]|uniref:DUF5819 family protein n=1 Tax=Streptomyces sp. NPDC050504 TaxID=3365618 RepID=UPI0037B766C6
MDSYDDKGAADVPAAAPRRAGIAGLSLPYQVVAALALAVIGVFGLVHLGMIFLHVAPANTVSKKHGKTIGEWVYPEFEQNWKLFAPNPLQQNIAVHVRAQVKGPGGRSTTDWISLSADDAAAIRGNVIPSHVNQNELRRGWDFFVNSHDNANQPIGLRGSLSEQYVRRIVMLRLEGRDLGGEVRRIQVRSSSTSVAPPPWSDEKYSTRPTYRVLPWWNVHEADRPGGKAPESRSAEDAK